MAPLGLPDKDEPGYHGKTAQYEQRDANATDSRAEPAGKRDADSANEAEGELKEDALKGRVPKGGNDERSKARHCSVDGISGHDK